MIISIPSCLDTQLENYLIYVMRDYVNNTHSLFFAKELFFTKTLSPDFGLGFFEYRSLKCFRKERSILKNFKYAFEFTITTEKLDDTKMGLLSHVSHRQDNSEELFPNQLYFKQVYLNSLGQQQGFAMNFTFIYLFN